MKLKFTIRKKIWIASLFIFTMFSYTGILNAESGANPQPQKSVTGIVNDEEGNPIPGVNIQVKGTALGGITDINGHYSLVGLPQDANVLIFSFVGMSTQEVNIDGKTEINIVLKEDIIGLDEVVFTGYMTQKKADLTGAVSVVNADDIERSRSANVMTALQGKVPGMVVTRADGNPAENLTVEIRGLTSLINDGDPIQPLIVVDGLPTMMNLRDINSNDIESIQVLKDAASASIYGARAASGVILITTKHGKAGQLRVDYDGHFGFSALTNRPDMCNTEEYGRAYWQACVNGGFDPNTMTQLYTYEWHDEGGIPVLDKLTPVEWLNSAHTLKSGDTDWLKEGTQMGMQNSHQLTLSGGTDKYTQMFSANFFENRGTQIYTGYKRYSMRLNSEYNALNGRLVIGQNLSLSASKLNDNNMNFELLTMPSIIPVRTVDGNEWGGAPTELGVSSMINPVRELTMQKNNYKHGLKAIGSVFASLELMKNLTVRTQYGIDYTNNYSRLIDFSWEEAGGIFDDINGVNNSQVQALNWTWTNTLNYHLDRGKHNLDVLAGMEAYRYTYEYLYGSRQDIDVEDYDYAILDVATGNQTLSGNADEYTLLSYFSKFNYAYNSKYLLSATLRYDGSSKFGKNNKFGFFPAVSAGWRLSNEDFLVDNNVISNLKLRTSWGRNGNSSIPTNAVLNYFRADYQWTAAALEGNESGSLLSGYYRAHTGNDNLKWETSEQLDIGLDFGLFNQRLSGSFDYFNKHTYGMLFHLSTIAVMGEGTSQWVNSADMTNKGVEFVLTYSSEPDRDFSYSITGNIGTNKNTIVELPEEVVLWFAGQENNTILGHPFRSLYGYVCDGIFQTQEEVDNAPAQPGIGVGRLKFKDLDNDGQITEEFDRTWIACLDPDFVYGMNFEARYKNFDFQMFWQGVAGNEFEQQWTMISDFWGSRIRRGGGRVSPAINHQTRILDAWTPTNTDTDIPALSLRTNGIEQEFSSFLIESGSYLKLRNVELGYTFSEGLINKLNMQKFRVYMSAQNLVTLRKWWGSDAFTSADPEEGEKSYIFSTRGYGIPMVFLFGVNVSF